MVLNGLDGGNAGLGIHSSVFWVNRSWLLFKMSDFEQKSEEPMSEWANFQPWEIGCKTGLYGLSSDTWCKFLFRSMGPIHSVYLTLWHLLYMTYLLTSALYLLSGEGWDLQNFFLQSAIPIAFAHQLCCQVRTLLHIDKERSISQNQPKMLILPNNICFSGFYVFYLYTEYNGVVLTIKDISILGNIQFLKWIKSAGFYLYFDIYCTVKLVPF